MWLVSDNADCAVVYDLVNYFQVEITSDGKRCNLACYYSSGNEESSCVVVTGTQEGCREALAMFLAWLDSEDAEEATTYQFFIPSEEEEEDEEEMVAAVIPFSRPEGEGKA